MTQPRPGGPLGATYRFSKRIGSGATGEVWQVESITEQTHYAAKILKPEYGNDLSLVERFVRERTVLSALDHPHIVRIHDLVVEGTTVALIMDYVPGGSLRELLEQRGNLPIGHALAGCAQVCEALAEAHRHHVTHRDIKPDNVLLAEPWQSGRGLTVRVADFGIAALMSEHRQHTTGLVGTPHYMAPEVISEGAVTAAADIYALGVMLYEMISGRTPFAGPGTDFTIAFRHVSAEVPALDVPAPLWNLMTQLLAKDPQARPTAVAVRAELQTLAGVLGDDTEEGMATGGPPAVLTERPVTVLRSEWRRGMPEPPDSDALLSLDPPDLGVSGQQTVVRSMAAPADSLTPVDDEPEVTSRRWPRWLPTVGVVMSVVLLLGIVYGAVVLLSDVFGGEEAEVTTSDAIQQDEPLPTGLAVTRQARYLSDEKRIELEVRYAASKAPLSGSFLHVIPPVDEDGTCPAVSWDHSTVMPHQQSRTGVAAECGWSLDGITIPANGQVQVTASFPAQLDADFDIAAWLNEASVATTTALSDPEPNSTAYPVQRLRSINVVTPARAVSQSTLTVTLVPVWPSGPDPFNPLYQSPATGTPSQMVRAIAGDESGIRFSDTCAGSVAVSPDGLVVTALSVTNGCHIRASVGNFTDLQGPTLSITTRD